MTSAAGGAGLDLHPAPEAYPWKKYPRCEAINAFARDIGAAQAAQRAGDAHKAGLYRAQLSKLVQ